MKLYVWQEIWGKLYMGCKKSKNNKGKEDIKNISKSDEFQLSLLNLQVKVILIYMISTIFLVYGVLQG